MTYCMKQTFIFKRKSFHYVIISYVPSALIVILSWISFWLDVEAAAPRTALSLTSLLTLTTQFGNIQNHVPSNGEIKAIDVWMLVCIVMVFASLMEFALGNSIHRRSSKESKLMQYRRTMYAQVYGNRKARQRYRNWCNHLCNFLKQKLKRISRICGVRCRIKKKNISFVDKIARFAFPMVFIVFNIIYWSVYLTTGVIDICNYADGM